MVNKKDVVAKTETDLDESRFEQILLDQARQYGEVLSRVLDQLFSVGKAEVSLGSIEKSLRVRADYMASIPFVGMVTGEFIVALTKDVAASVFAGIQAEDEIRGTLAETLNMAAGSCLSRLTQVFPKTTISTPRLLSGEMKYPSVKNVSIHLKYKSYALTAYFYVDRMRLDIADSYVGVIKELQKTNQELSVANSRLKEQQAQLVHSEKMASLGVMAAGVAHEINNPLAFVLSNTDVLNTYIGAMSTLLSAYEELIGLMRSGRKDEASNEFHRISEFKDKEDISFILADTRKLLEESKFGLERIRGIVNGLKRFSRVSDMGVKSVQINDELTNTLLLLSNELKFRCTVETDFRAQKEVECLPGEMSQVFMNLIINAAQAIPDERKGTEGKITISTEDVPQGVRIKIADNGSGISPENLEKIFNPFFTTKPVGEGTGLGLAISHGIIQKHGGSISVSSILGKGTEFVIEIPYQAIARTALAA